MRDGTLCSAGNEEVEFRGRLCAALAPGAAQAELAHHHPPGAPRNASGALVGLWELLPSPGSQNGAFFWKSVFLANG